MDPTVETAAIFTASSDESPRRAALESLPV